MSGNSIEPKEGQTKAYFSFGRFQPPTLGHKVLLTELADKAAAAGADAYVFVSSSENDVDAYLKSKKYRDMQAAGKFESIKENENPLDVGTKVAIMKKQYAGTTLKIINTTTCGCRTLFTIVDALRSAGYTDLTMLVGSDRVAQFTKTFTPKDPKFPPSVKVVGAGAARNMSAEVANVGTAIPLAKMKGTLMRMAAVTENLDALKAGVMFGEVTEADVKELMNKIRKGLGYPAVAGGRRRAGTRRQKHIRLITRKQRKYRLRLEERT
jgi:nicotinic acid mononucleotide adenylyltransferase